MLVSVKVVSDGMTGRAAVKHCIDKINGGRRVRACLFVSVVARDPEMAEKLMTERSACEEPKMRLQMTLPASSRQLFTNIATSTAH